MESSQNTFISSTYWTENTGTAAAIKTLSIMKKIKSWKIITSKGKKIKREFQKIADKHKLQIKIKGIDALPGFEFNKKNSLYQNFICEQMLKKGFLFKNTVYLSVSHSEKMISNFLKNLDEIFALLKKRKIKNINSINDFKRIN
jgi:glutamate-1-semialdehyde aminotransferase